MDLFTNFGERISRTAMKSIFGVAPGATKIAAGKPHENTGQSRPRPLALNRFEYFRNNHIEALGSVRRRAETRLSRCGQATGLPLGSRASSAQNHRAARWSRVPFLPR